MRILLLAIISFCLVGCFSIDVSGKYFDISEDGVTHYIDFKEDGTFFHFYKKDTVIRSHTGNWKQRTGKDILELDSWVVYSKSQIEQMDGFGNITFGTKMGNMLFWKDNVYLNTSPAGADSSSFVKEHYVDQERKRRLEEKIEQNRKDTIRYDTGEIRGIGKSDYKDKRGVWIEYYKSGKVEGTGEYFSGNKYGFWKYYYENGKLKSIGAYSAVSKIGPWEYYHENGNIKEKGVYLNDYVVKNIKANIWKIYDSNGKLIKTEVYRSREKHYDSIFKTKFYNYSKKQANEARIKKIIDEDKYYLEYKKSLENK
ncbi:MAG: hypothetical protein QM535_03280 [Limnohabitans sp.]|nr:hypothetical protein [Limnohabitans sp.]